MLFCVLVCPGVLCYTNAMFFCAVLCHVVVCCTVLCFADLRLVVLCYLCSAVLCYLCCVVLLYAMICCGALCCAVLQTDRQTDRQTDTQTLLLSLLLCYLLSVMLLLLLLCALSLFVCWFDWLICLLVPLRSLPQSERSVTIHTDGFVLHLKPIFILSLQNRAVEPYTGNHVHLHQIACNTVPHSTQLRSGYTVAEFAGQTRANIQQIKLQLRQVR